MLNKSFSHILLTVFLALFYLTGCVKLFPEKNTDGKIFVLDIKNIDTSGIDRVSWQLLIDQTQAPPHLNKQLIAAILNNDMVTYVEDVSWSDDLPMVFQTVLMDAFLTSEKIEGIGRSTVGLDAKYALLTTIDHFEILKTEKEPTLYVSFTAQLMERKTRKIIDTKTFSRKSVLEKNSAKSVGEGFQKSVEILMNDLIKWTLKRS